MASVPAPDDPDSYIRKAGPDAFREVLTRAQSFFDFYLQHLITGNDPATDRGRLAILAGMGSKLQLTGNAVLIDTYAQRTAQRLGVSVDAVRTEFRKIKAPAPRPEPAEARGPTERPSAPDSGDTDPVTDPAAAGSPPAEPPTRPQPNDVWLIKYLCQADEELLDWTMHHLDPQWIQHPVTRKILQARLHQAGGDMTMTALLTGLGEDAFARQLVTEAASEQRPIANVPTQLADVTRRFRDQWIDRQIVLLGSRLSDPALPHEAQIHAMREQQQLRALKRQPLTPIAEA